jgi:hypothetical protein
MSRGSSRMDCATVCKLPALRLAAFFPVAPAHVLACLCVLEAPAQCVWAALLAYAALHAVKGPGCSAFLPASSLGFSAVTLYTTAVCGQRASSTQAMYPRPYQFAADLTLCSAALSMLTCAGCCLWLSIGRLYVQAAKVPEGFRMRCTSV